ncbi:MAG: hypothetical protein ACKVKG_03155 [Alphaproteobacteria bacterium]|jgi:4-hydroxy-2-oxoheptanedioate aldolase
MRENKLKTLWANGGAAMNCWLSMDSSLAAEAMAYCDWDSITVDMQHSLIDWRSALTMLQAASQKDAPTLMRVPWLDPAWIMRALMASSAPWSTTARIAKNSSARVAMRPPVIGAGAPCAA